MSGYPGYSGNQGAMGVGQDVEMGGVGASDPRMMGGVPGVGMGAPTAAFMTQAAANPTQQQGGAYSGYGQPPPPQSSAYGGPSKPYNPYAGGQGQASGYGGGKPTYHQPQYAGYGQTQAGGGYAAPPIQQPPPPPPPPSQYIQDMDLAVRHGFVRKVYCILVVQLLFTFGLVAVFSYIPAVQHYVMNNDWVMGVSFGAVFAILIGMTCCPGRVMHRFPLNLILLMLFSCFMGAALGVTAARFACDQMTYDRFTGEYQCVNNADAPLINGRMSVLLAMAITLAVVVLLTLFACQTKYDFTGSGPYLMAALLIFIIFFAIAGIWLRFNKVYNLVYACIGVLMFSALLIYNTQMVVGGKNRKYSLSPDDYILGALTIYMDIINLFMFILTIIGFSR
mmetsp:Transcript_8176/g.20960  ORF Transcript_8176/g.20960 Transcript_8176/m.20960 type:complete len:393 (-) Transcript_8176:64-1242(-)